MNQTLYPPVYDGTYPYTTPLGRLTLTAAEQLIICNPYYIGRAYQNAAYNYVSSSSSSEEVKYDIDNGALSPSSLDNSTVTQALNTLHQVETLARTDCLDFLHMENGQWHSMWKPMGFLLWKIHRRTQGATGGLLVLRMEILIEKQSQDRIRILLYVAQTWNESSTC